MHNLKKYPNRRLYDTTDSKYVTVEDVRLLIVSGESIRVEDSKNGNNLTRTVLLQILAEQESEGHEPVLTNRVIEQMIRFYGHQLGGVAASYIEQSMVAFLDHQDQFRQRMRQLGDFNPLNMMRQAFDGSWGMPRPPGNKSTAKTGPAASAADKIANHPPSGTSPDNDDGDKQP